MTKKSKRYLFITLSAFVLMYVGAWAYTTGGTANKIGGAICFLIGFIICLVLYGGEFLNWWS